MFSGKGLCFSLAVLESVCIDSFFFGFVISLGRDVKTHARPSNVIVVNLVYYVPCLLDSSYYKLYLVLQIFRLVYLDLHQIVLQNLFASFRVLFNLSLEFEEPVVVFYEIFKVKGFSF